LTTYSVFTRPLRTSIVSIDAKYYAAHNSK